MREVAAGYPQEVGTGDLFTQGTRGVSALLRSHQAGHPSLHWQPTLSVKTYMERENLHGAGKATLKNQVLIYLLRDFSVAENHRVSGI